jgi:hypothetical protein
MRKSAILTCLFGIILFLLCPGIKAQDDDRYEIGINALTIRVSESSSLFRAQTPPLHGFYGSGIYFKTYKKNHGLRLSLNYYKEVYHQERYDYYYGSRIFSYNYGISKSTELTIGYQYLIIKGRISPFVFADVRSAYSEVKGVQECATCLYFTAQNPVYESKVASVGLAPGAGVRIQLYKNFMMSAESAIENLFISDLENAENFKPNYGLKFRPLQINFGITF